MTLEETEQYLVRAEQFQREYGITPWGGKCSLEALGGTTCLTDLELYIDPKYKDQYRELYLEQGGSLSLVDNFWGWDLIWLGEVEETVNGD